MLVSLAVSLFLTIATHPDSTDNDRAFYRHYAAAVLSSDGEAERARTQYQIVIDHFGGSSDKKIQKIVGWARDGITRLDKRQ